MVASSNPNETSQLEKSIFDRMRKPTGIKDLDYDLDAIDEIATMENYGIQKNGDTSSRLKNFCSWLNGIEHGFNVAKAYMKQGMQSEAQSIGISEARECLALGKLNCLQEYSSPLAAILVAHMEEYFIALQNKSLLK